MKLPNYNLIRYEISDIDSDKDQYQIYLFYVSLCKKYTNFQKELFDWFKTFSKKELQRIHITTDENIKWFSYRFTNPSTDYMRTVVAKHKIDVDHYWLLDRE